MGFIKSVLGQIMLDSTAGLIDGAVDKAKLTLEKAAEKKLQKSYKTF